MDILGKWRIVKSSNPRNWKDNPYIELTEDQYISYHKHNNGVVKPAPIACSYDVDKITLTTHDGRSWSTQYEMKNDKLSMTSTDGTEWLLERVDSIEGVDQ